MHCEPDKLSQRRKAQPFLEINFSTRTIFIALDAKAYRNRFKEALQQGVIGGRTYDSVIAVCVVKAKLSVLSTFSAKEFLPFSLERLEIRVPGKAVPKVIQAWLMPPTVPIQLDEGST